MECSKLFLSRILVAVVAFALCGGAEAAQALTQDPQQQQTPPQQQAPQQQSAPIQGTTVNPSQGPLTPVPSEVPQAPSATPEQNQAQPAPTTVPTQSPAAQQRKREPLGAAAAEGVPASGGLASRPAGTAIAPAKQHQVRSVLIKLGVVAAAGAAIGTVYALSRGTSSTPPGH